MATIIGFVARPLGAVLFGRLGNTRGRKLPLLIAMQWMGLGLGTMSVGVTPAYALIGLTAPVLLGLRRIVQGISASGDLGNAVVLVGTTEAARPRATWLQQPRCPRSRRVRLRESAHSKLELTSHRPTASRVVRTPAALRRCIGPAGRRPVVDRTTGTQTQIGT